MDEEVNKVRRDHAGFVGYYRTPQRRDDSRFRHLSDRLTISNGILMIGTGAICAIVLTGGSITPARRHLLL